MILLLSDPNDDTAKFVAERLKERNASFRCFDNRQFPSASFISVRLEAAAAASERQRARLRLSDETYDLSQISAAWDWRPRPVMPHDEIRDEVARLYVERQARDFLADLWHDLDCLWIPATRAKVRQAEQKMSQLGLAQELGFEIPPTLFTNDPQAFLDFYRAHDGRIISKPVRSGFIWADAEPAKSDVRGMVYTEVVTNRDVGYAETIRYCPVILQAYVPKSVELRVTVVGERVFAAEIHSQQTNRTRHDWRHYDLYRTPHHAQQLPREIEQQILRLTERLGLCYGAIDLILTPGGRYVFLEINPSGQYGWIEELTGLPITDALCDLLMSRETS